MTKISNVLVLGCTGLVGHGVSLYLVKKNFYVVGTANDKNIKSTNKNFKVYRNINLLNEKSFTKIESIIKKNKIQAVIHSAALVPNKLNYQSKNFFNDSVKINSLSFLNLYKISKKNNVNFLINISTPNVKNVDKIDLEIHHNFYIFTKYLAELFLSKLINSKTNIVSLRIKSPYGYILDTKAVIPNFIKKIINNQKLILKGNINKKQTFTFVEDIGSACEEIFKNNLTGVKNCFGTEQITIRNLANLIENVFSKKIKSKEFKNFRYASKFSYKKNINILKTSLNEGLLKILKTNKNFEIFKIK